MHLYGARNCQETTSKQVNDDLILRHLVMVYTRTDGRRGKHVTTHTHTDRQHCVLVQLRARLYQSQRLIAVLFVVDLLLCVHEFVCISYM